MKEIISKSKCTGCHACYSICPKQCISMQADENGFLYPKIDKEKCIECGLCEKACPLLNEKKQNDGGSAYACINTNDRARMKSSSGGVFSLLAENIIENGGSVLGAAFDENLDVSHIEIRKKEELDLLRGSKYVQSRIGESYKKVKEYLESGRLVLFSGTPCQIGGLKNYLNKDYENLLTVDIICHGVPSPSVWQKYLGYLKKVCGSAADCKSLPTFRDKSEGWKRYAVYIILRNGNCISEYHNDNLFMKSFLKNYSLRDSCYNCYYKTVERESDITLADFWGVEVVAPDMFDDKGTSLVFVNSDKGNKIFERIADKMIYRSVDVSEAVKYNSAAYMSVPKPKHREEFLKKLTSENFGKVVNKHCKPKFSQRLVSKGKRIIKGVLGR